MFDLARIRRCSLEGHDGGDGLLYQLANCQLCDRGGVLGGLPDKRTDVGHPRHTIVKTEAALSAAHAVTTMENSIVQDRCT